MFNLFIISKQINMKFNKVFHPLQLTPVKNSFVLKALKISVRLKIYHRSIKAKREIIILYVYCFNHFSYIRPLINTV